MSENTFDFDAPVHAPAIDYTARDFASIKANLVSLLQSLFPDDWKDFYESGVGTALLELIAYSHDLLSFQLDQVSQEVWLPTARERHSIINLGKLVGYTLRSATPALLQLRGTILPAYDKEIIFPVGTSIMHEGLTFELLEQKEVAKYAGFCTLNLTEGVSRSESFTADGTILQRYKLAFPNVIDGTLIVKVGGVTWTELDSLVYADISTTMTAYALSRDEDEYVTVNFGDGVAGAVPQVATSVSVSYRTGGGVKGNVASRTVVGQLKGYLKGVIPTTWVDVDVINLDPGRGGEDRETIEWAKYWIPRWVRTNDRAVTEYDYDVLASKYSSPTYGAVAIAKSQLKQEIPELNTVQIRVWARNSEGQYSTPSTALKQALYDYFRNDSEGAIRPIVNEVEILDGINLYVDVYTTIRLDLVKSYNDVVAKISTRLTDYFNSPRVVPGEDVHVSHLYEVVQKTEGINYCYLDRVVGSWEKEVQIGVGNASDLFFTFDLQPATLYTFDYNDLPCAWLIATSMVCTSKDSNGATLILQDLSAGTLPDTGVFVGDGTGNVSYRLGTGSVTFDDPPGMYEPVMMYFRYMAYRQHAITVNTSVSPTEYQGELGTPPIVPGTVSFTVGPYTIVDDKSGHLTYGGGQIGTINYTTSDYYLDLTSFGVTVQNQKLTCTFVQYLSISTSDNLPTTKDELGVRGLLMVTEKT